MFNSFSSPRLLVKSIANANTIDCHAIMEVLTPNVTAQLPERWQEINTEKAANLWLRDRLNEGPVFQITEKAPQSLMGFLFLYETPLNNGNDEVEIRLGYLLSEQYWGNGLASELIKSLIIECQKQGVNNLIGGVTKDNIGSAKVLTKNGFVLVGNNSESGSETEFYEYRF